MATVPFSFQRDAALLPKLASSGNNYAEWRAAWSIALKYRKLWRTVSGGGSRPASTSTPEEIRAQERWDRKDVKARVLLLSSIPPDLFPIVASHESSTAAWNYLAGKFDGDAGAALIHLSRSLAELRFEDGEDLRAHVEEFSRRWMQIAQHCENATHKTALAMRPTFASDELKGSTFLASLPATMDNVIADLSKRNIMSFEAIKPRFFEIAESQKSRRQAEHHDRRAAPAPESPDPRVKEEAEDRQPLNEVEPAKLECSWCWRRRLDHLGHTRRQCTTVNVHQRKRQEQKAAHEEARRAAQEAAQREHQDQKSANKAARIATHQAAQRAAHEAAQIRKAAKKRQHISRFVSSVNGDHGQWQYGSDAASGPSTSAPTRAHR